MMYLTFDEYLNYGGTLNDEVLYERLEYQSRMLLDMMTLGRIDADIAKLEPVKRCMFELVEAHNQNRLQNANGYGVTSVSNDGVSVSYGSNGSGNSFAKHTREIVTQYLSSLCLDEGIPLLYKGVI